MTSSKRTAAATSERSEPRTELHVTRWFDGYKASAVEAVSVAEDCSHCAVGRSDGSIEIWDLQGSFVERVIPGVGENTVKSLVLLTAYHGTGSLSSSGGFWNKRYYVLSGGLHGWLSVWDCESLSMIAKISSSAIWSVAAQKQTAEPTADGLCLQWLCSAACDNGTLRLFKVRVPPPNVIRHAKQGGGSNKSTQVSHIGNDEPARIDLWQTLSVSGGASGSTPRCLSTCWSPSGRRVFGANNSGVIAGFEVKSDRIIDDGNHNHQTDDDGLMLFPSELARIRIVRRVDRVFGKRKNGGRSVSSRHKSSLWSLSCVSEDLVACATSSGTVDVYSALNGTLDHSVVVSRMDANHSTCDVLCLSSNSESGVLVCGLMDGTVVQCSGKRKSGVSSADGSHPTPSSSVSSMSGRNTLVHTGYHARHNSSDVLAIDCSKKWVVSGAMDGSLTVCGTRDFFRHYSLNPFTTSFANNSDRDNYYLSLSKCADLPAWLDGVIPEEPITSLIDPSLRKNKGEKSSSSNGGSVLLSSSLNSKSADSAKPGPSSSDRKKAYLIGNQVLVSRKRNKLCVWRAVDGVQILCITLTTMDDDGESPILSFSVSDCAQFVCASTISETWIFELEKYRISIPEDESADNTGMDEDLIDDDNNDEDDELLNEEDIDLSDNELLSDSEENKMNDEDGHTQAFDSKTLSKEDEIQRFGVKAKCIFHEWFGCSTLVFYRDPNKHELRLYFSPLQQTTDTRLSGMKHAMTKRRSLPLVGFVRIVQPSDKKSLSLAATTNPKYKIRKYESLEIDESDLLSKGISWQLGQLVTSMCISEHGRWLGLSISSLGRSMILDRESGRVAFVCSKGPDRCGVSCLRMQELKRDRTEVWMIYGNNHLKVWCLEGNVKKNGISAVKSSIHPWCSRNWKAWDTYNKVSSFALTTISFNPGKAYKPLLCRPEYLTPLNLKRDLFQYSSSVSRKRKFSQMALSDGAKQPSSEQDRSIKLIRRYNSCLMVAYLGTDELLLVHRPRSMVYDRSETALYRKRYGV